jgi:hypothetical protein
VRKDLSYEQQTVQACHAAIEATKAFPFSREVSNLVICQVDDEEHLINSAVDLDWARIRYIFFEEPDINNECTALCTEVIYGEQRKVFKKYELLKV